MANLWLITGAPRCGQMWRSSRRRPGNQSAGTGASERQQTSAPEQVAGAWGAALQQWGTRTRMNITIAALRIEYVNNPLTCPQDGGTFAFKPKSRACSRHSGDGWA